MAIYSIPLTTKDTYVNIHLPEGVELPRDLIFHIKKTVDYPINHPYKLSSNFFLSNVSKNEKNENSSIVSVMIINDNQVNFIQLLVGSNEIKEVVQSKSVDGEEEILDEQSNFSSLNNTEKLYVISLLKKLEADSNSTRDMSGFIEKILNSMDTSFAAEINIKTLPCKPAIEALEYLNDKELAKINVLLKNSNVIAEDDSDVPELEEATLNNNATLSELSDAINSSNDHAESEAPSELMGNLSIESSEVS